MYSRRKALGQHFLISDGIADKIVSSLGIPPGARILEVGPGRGFLTERLIKAGYEVVGIEKDEVLFQKLKELHHRKLTVLNEDILNINLKTFVEEHSISAIVSNLPYVISTRFVEKLVREMPSVEEIVLMFQKEVADKLIAPAGSRNTGPLSIALQEFFSVRKLFNVKPGAFNPPPSVQSSVLKMTPLSGSSLERELSGEYLDFLFLLFENRRKKIKHKLNLQCEIENSVFDKRAEEIDARMLRELFRCYRSSLQSNSVE